MTDEEYVQKATDMFHGYDIRVELAEPVVLDDEDGIWVRAWVLVGEDD